VCNSRAPKSLSLAFSLYYICMCVYVPEFAYYAICTYRILYIVTWLNENRSGSSRVSQGKKKNSRYICIFLLLESGRSAERTRTCRLAYVVVDPAPVAGGGFHVPRSGSSAYTGDTV